MSTAYIILGGMLLLLVWILWSAISQTNKMNWNQNK